MGGEVTSSDALLALIADLYAANAALIEQVEQLRLQAADRQPTENPPAPTP
jgi:hypothetical protein